MEPLYFVQTVQEVRTQADFIDYLVRKVDDSATIQPQLHEFDSLLVSMGNLNGVIREFNTLVSRFKSKDTKVQIDLETHTRIMRGNQEIHDGQRKICTQYIDIQDRIYECVSDLLPAYKEKSKIKDTKDQIQLRGEYIQYRDRAGIFQEIVASIARHHTIPQGLVHAS